MPQIGTQVQEVFAPLRLGHNIEVATKRQLQLAAAEQFKMARQFAHGAACPLGDGMIFALARSKEGDDTVSFPQVGALEGDSLGGITTLMSHGEYQYYYLEKRRDQEITSVRRRRADSNRWCSFCRAVPYHLATSPKN